MLFNESCQLCSRKELPLPKKIFAILVLVLISSTSLKPSFAGGMGAGDKLPAESTRSLKKYMANFGSMIAGLEIMKLKEKKPDWDAINITLQEMSSTLSEMQQADTTNAYKEYTDVLAAGLVDLKAQSKIRDKKIFEGIDKLSNTCFQCHAAHRPADFILPKKNQRLTDQ